MLEGGQQNGGTGEELTKETGKEGSAGGKVHRGLSAADQQSADRLRGRGLLPEAGCVCLLQGGKHLLPEQEHG